MLSLLLASLLATISMQTAHAEEQAPTPPVKPALAITVAVPTQETWAASITANGSLAPWHEAVIASEIGGQRIAQILVDVGDRVERGQELVRLAQDAIQADIAQAKARVAQAEASLEEARTNAARARSLKASGALPAQQIDQYLTGEATATAALTAQKAALQAQQIRLAQTRITAPDDGVISSRSASLGAVVQTGTELFRLVRQNRIEWRAEIPSNALGRIQPGQTARLNLPNGDSVSGEVRMVSPTLDPNTRTAIAYISLPPDSPARAGMFAEGEILTGSYTALTVPQSAVILRDGNNYVFEVGADNKVSQRFVKTGRRADGKVEILDGLKHDTKVVTTGGAFLNDGDTVDVVRKPANSLGDKSEGQS